MLYVDTFGAAGGVGRCSIELLPFLTERTGEVTLAGRSHIIDSYGATLAGSKRLHFRNLDRPWFHPSAVALRVLGRTAPLSSAFTEAFLDRAGIRAANCHPVLINYPQVLAPPRKNYEFDIFLHDLNWCHYPENSSEPEGLDRRCREWAQQAKRIFTNSEFTRREVIELYGVEAGRVIAAPLAPPSLSVPTDSNGGTEKLERLGLKPNGYFFYPSVHGAHKGHDVLADALAAALSTTLPVVITAAIDPDQQKFPEALRGYLQTVTGKLQALHESGKIIALPGLPWEQVMLIARSCRAYVLPSRFEGFGFPLVEAMALGKFSICSDIPPFQEILQRYGPLIRAATFPSGDAPALRELLVAQSRADGPGAMPEAGPPNLSSGWGWADTANAIATAL